MRVEEHRSKGSPAVTDLLAIRYWRPRMRAAALGVALALGAPASGVASAPVATQPEARTPHVAAPGARAATRLVVRWQGSVSLADRAAAIRQAGADRVRHLRTFDADVIRPRGSLADVLDLLRRDRRVASVEPDAHLALAGDPTGEPLFGQQWALNNAGQPIEGFAGIPNVDLDGLDSLAITEGSSNVVVAVIDSGVDFGHPDLVGEAWTNPGETGLGREVNGIDDDRNGYVDDVHGYDVCHDDSTVHDLGQDWHGTAVASLIAAGINGVGMAGIAPGVRIMAVKFLDDTGSSDCGTFSDAVAAIEYATANGARILNTSWGATASADQVSALRAAIVASGALVVASAGNGGDDSVGDDLDREPIYPAAFSASNILTVTAIQNEAGLSGFSNYGEGTVDVAAPGEDIVVAMPATATEPASWSLADGTSFAAPFATGVAALAASVRPELLDDPVALRRRVISTGWPLQGLLGRTTSGRVVDARFAIDTVAPKVSPPSVTVLDAVTLDGSFVPVRFAWPAAADDVSITSYTLELRPQGGSWRTVSATGELGVERTLRAGVTYEARVTARDASGNHSRSDAVPIKVTTLEERSHWARTAGRWTSSSGGNASGGSTLYASRAGASYSLLFEGRAIALVAPRSSIRGRAEVWIDGEYVTTINLNATTPRSRQVVFSTGWAASGMHAIRLLVLGDTPHPRVDVDSFLVVE